MLHIEINGFKRINKTSAERAYNAGKAVYILPCKVRFENPWIKPYKAMKSERFNPISNDGFNTIIPRNSEFETIVNCYTFYNCAYNELGKYPAYYVKEGDI